MQSDDKKYIKELTIPNKIKRLFLKDPETNLHNPKLYLVGQAVLGGSLAGFFIGGRIGARIGGVEHIESTKLEVYTTPTHAERAYQSRVSLAYVKNGSRFGWRAGLFAGVYSLSMVVISELNESSYESLNYIGAGAITGIIYKSLSGWREMVAAAIIGSALSSPVAGMMSLLHAVVPEEAKKELSYTGLSKRFNMDDNEELSESQARMHNLKVTDQIIADLEKDLETNNMDFNGVGTG